MKPNKSDFFEQDLETFSHFRQGNYLADKRIFEWFYKPLCLFANSWLDNLDEAEDIVSDVFAKAFMKRAGFATPINLKAFLYISTRNACVNCLEQRERHHLRNKKLYHLAERTTISVEMRIVRSEVLSKVHTFLDQLPTKCKQIVILYYFDGKSLKEVAELLSISIHTARNQKQRGLNLLKAKWAAMVGKSLTRCFSCYD